MPWKENRVQDQRSSLLQEHQEGASISELSEIYDVSRKTIDKWLDRYQQEGTAGLVDQSRRPRHSPHQVSAEVEAAIIAARQRWKWGPGKLRVKLCQSDPERQWPAVSTRSREIATPVQVVPPDPTSSTTWRALAVSAGGAPPTMANAFAARQNGTRAKRRFIAGMSRVRSAMSTMCHAPA